MINSTNVKVPKKYEHMIEEIYHDSDGYWAHSAKGFEFEEMGCHTAHEYTQKDLLDMIRTLQPCQCSECKEVEKVEVVEMEVIETVEKPKKEIMERFHMLEGGIRLEGSKIPKPCYMQDEVEKYVVIDLERSIKAGQMYYWKANGFGYTFSIWEAGEYTKEDAVKFVDGDINKRTVSISLDEVERILR